MDEESAEYQRGYKKGQDDGAIHFLPIYMFLGVAMGMAAGMTLSALALYHPLAKQVGRYNESLLLAAQDPKVKEALEKVSFEFQTKYNPDTGEAYLTFKGLGSPQHR